MDARLRRPGTGRVVRQDQRQRAVALAVGALVVGRRVPGAGVAVGVHLSQPDQAERGEVLARAMASGLTRKLNGVVTASGTVTVVATPCTLPSGSRNRMPSR